jgi:23S rRNA pseudouridine2605 synthase
MKPKQPAPPPTPEEPISLHRFLKRLKRFSVREAERLIRDGRVAVDGQVETRPEARVTPGRSEVRVDGAPMDAAAPAPSVIYLMNKPQGVVCTRKDEKGRETIFNALPSSLGYLFSVGRLDLMSEGALLLTNDGALADRLAQPRSHVPKRYHVKIQGAVDARRLRPLEEGVELDGSSTLPCSVRVLSRTERNTWTEWELVEGRNRQIRRMCEAVGLFAMKVNRVAIGPLELGDLKRGTWRKLEQHELAALETASHAMEDKPEAGRGGRKAGRAPSGRGRGQRRG